MVTLSWYLDYEGMHVPLANTSVLVNSIYYYFYSGTVTGENCVGFPGQTLVFEVGSNSPGGMIWGGGNGGSTITIPGGLSLPPVAPQLISPTDAAIDQANSLTLCWSSVPDAMQYHMQLATDSLFTVNLHDFPAVSDTAKSITALQTNTTYFWRVRAINAGGASAWSSIWTFTTIINVPAMIDLVSPSNAAVITTDSLRFVWRQGSVTNNRFWFELAFNSQMTDAIVDTNLAANDTIKVVLQLIDKKTYWWRVRAKNKAGWGPFGQTRQFSIDIPTSVVDNENIVSNFQLHQNYPNPFNPATTIEFGVKEACQVVLKVYDVTGQEVTTLVDAKHAPGLYQINFDARTFPSGIYFYKIQMNGFQAVKKMVLVE